MSPTQPVTGPDDLQIREPEEAPQEDLWETVDDTGEADIEFVVASEDEEKPWEPVDDSSKDDIDLQVQAEAEATDPWGPLNEHRPEPLGEVPPSLPIFSTPTPLPRWKSRARLPSPSEVIPWRGTMRVQELLGHPVIYFAAPEQETSQLLVSAWEWDEEAESPSHRLLLHLTDDGPEVQVQAITATEPVTRLSGYLGKTRIEIHAVLSVERGRRGLLLGRDVLAGSFLVDCNQDDEDSPPPGEAQPPPEAG
ncbi:MAG: hypothetical protein VX498_15890 [Myxococcota bacterium]|nr:hypothetical protein [Myxococcota bacterium]